MASTSTATRTRSSAVSPSSSSMTMTVRKAYRIDEVACMLAISKRTVYDMIERGDMEALKLSNSVGQRTFMRIPTSSLDRFLNDPKRRVV